MLPAPDTARPSSDTPHPSGAAPSPWGYVPSLYFCEGIPYIMVMSVSAILYKRMGLSNEFIGMTSLLYVPWVIKMFWSPMVDLHRTKRFWILRSQVVLALCFAAVAASLVLPGFVWVSLTLFLAIAFLSATQDIAIDGFYMLALSQTRQAFFMGVRSLFYRFAVLFGQGALVVLAGYLERTTGRIPASWAMVLTVPAAVFCAAAMYHNLRLPRPVNDQPVPGTGTRGLREAFRTYLAQERVAVVLAFILLYRLGEAMLVKMTAPFLLDPPAAGGLGMSTEAVGYIYGTLGIISLAAGGIIGGWAIARFGLRRCLWPMALMLNAPDLLYVYMAVTHPGPGAVSVMVACEQFGYGLGFTAFSVFLMYIARPPFQTSHFAISTGLMALGMMLPGMASGLLQARLGYSGFFMLVCVCTLPGMLLIFRLPHTGPDRAGQT